MLKQYVLIFFWLMSNTILLGQECRPLDTIAIEDFSFERFYGYTAAFADQYLLIIGGSITEETADYLLGEVPNKS